MRTAALIITAFVATFVTLSVAYGVSTERATASPTGDSHRYHGLPVCGSELSPGVDADDDCYLPPSLSHLPGHVPAVILNGVVYTVDEFLN